MRFPSKEQVKAVKNAYPEGCRVELVHMDDVQAPPTGTEGTVIGVDDTGTVHVAWDNGSSLGVVMDKDSARRI